MRFTAQRLYRFSNRKSNNVSTILTGANRPCRTVRRFIFDTFRLWNEKFRVARQKRFRRTPRDSSNCRTAVRSHYRVKLISGKALGRSYRVWTSVYNQLEWEACLPVGVAKPGGDGGGECWSGGISSEIQSRRNVDSPKKGPGFEIPRGRVEGGSISKNHVGSGDNNNWSQLRMETCPTGWDRGRRRRRDYKRYCGIVTGDGRGRAVDRTVDRLIIALYSRTNAARRIRKSIRTGFIYFFHRGQIVGRRRHARRLSHVICPPQWRAIRPGVRTLPTVAANPR